ncbi:hypothetical protein B0H14DRAFT_647354 [Mycena olivaceomarginata]|nr:hypothetical protein B0H14DRAFT_647354 [Mycena olivaceomarginata]
MPTARTHKLAFFAHATNFTINGGTFVNTASYMKRLESRAPRRELRDSESVALRIIQAETVFPLKQLVSKDDYRIHAAQMDGRAVTVKVFSGRRARTVCPSR